MREALPRVPEVEGILQRNEETLPLWCASSRANHTRSDYRTVLNC